MVDANPRDGGPAFPAAGFPLSGMTLLQWYAGQALAGMLSNSSVIPTGGNKAIATAAFDQAAAMIAEGEKRK